MSLNILQCSDEQYKTSHDGSEATIIRNTLIFQAIGSNSKVYMEEKTYFDKYGAGHGGSHGKQDHGRESIDATKNLKIDSGPKIDNNDAIDNSVQFEIPRYIAKKIERG